MGELRKLVVCLLLAAAAAGLVLATFELITHGQWASVPSHADGFSTDARARLVEARVDSLNSRVGDVELLVMILLGSSGLYAIVFVLSSYLSMITFTRLADRTVRQMRDQIDAAIAGFREVQAETEKKLQAASAESPTWERQIAEITAGVAILQDVPPQDRSLDEFTRLELIEDEHAAAHIEKAAGAQNAELSLALSSALAGLHLQFARIYATSDPARSRFYLDRALRLAAPESALTAEIRYEMACRFAVSRDFSRSLRELTAVFEHQFKSLDTRLARDIEPGGKLYALASTPPFDKAVNDLLLTINIGIS
jgi:hypothetical protein